MLRFGIGLLVGVGLGVAIFLLVRPSRSWEENSIREQADALSCSLAVGLGAECVPVASLEKTGPTSWTVTYGRPGGRGRHICYELRPNAVPPQRRACSK